VLLNLLPELTFTKQKDSVIALITPSKKGNKPEFIPFKGEVN